MLPTMYGMCMTEEKMTETKALTTTISIEKVEQLENVLNVDR